MNGLLLQHCLKIGSLERTSYGRMNINVFLNYMRFVKLDVKRRRNKNDLCEKLKKGNEKSSSFIIHKRFCKKQFVFRHHQSITFWSLNIIYVNFLNCGVDVCMCYLRGVAKQYFTRLFDLLSIEN